MAITLDDIKAWSGVIAAIVAAASAIYQFYLVKDKEWGFEEERQSFASRERLAKEDADRRLADEGRKSQELLSKSAQVGAERLQKQKLEYDAWKQVLEDKIKDRIASVKALKMAMAQVFDSFESLLADAQHKDDHLILNPLSLCISALSEMDKAVKEASKIAQSRAEKARVNRLRVMKKFFLGVILDLTRRKSERSAQRELFESLSKRLSRRREIAERHIDIVLQSVSTPPSDA